MEIRNQCYDEKAYKNRAFENINYKRCIFNNTLYENCNFINCTFDDCVFHDVDFFDCIGLRNNFYTFDFRGKIWYINSNFRATLFYNCIGENNMHYENSKVV